MYNDDGATAAKRSEARQGYRASVAVVIPTLNEEGYIARCLDSLLGQFPEGVLQILVVDGGSSDRTREIVALVGSRDPRIALLDNPRRLQSAAFNLAALRADPRVTTLIRADAHATYPQNYVKRCVQVLEETGATSVVVPMNAVGRTGFQRAVAAAQNSLLGNGGSAHRTGCHSGFVDHGHHAAFNRRFFLSVGGYDESFSHNEDAEHDYRALQAGGRIWMCRDAVVTYYPRKDVPGLGRQYFNHGRGRAKTILKHRAPPKFRQLAPLAALSAVVSGVTLSALHWIFAVPVLMYLALCQVWAACCAVKVRDSSVLGMGVAATVMHLSWAFGFLVGLINGRAAVSSENHSSTEGAKGDANEGILAGNPAKSPSHRKAAAN